jgi:hypothetical protein
MADLAALEARHAALKGEPGALGEGIAGSVPVAHSGSTRLAHGSRVDLYDSMEPKLDGARVRKRAVLIKRAIVMGVAFMATVLICTLTSQLVEQGHVVLFGGSGGNLATTLKTVSPELTEGERKLFASDAKRLAAEEALHRKLDRDRAAHLLKMITDTVHHNEENTAMEEQMAAKAKEHREDLAARKQERNAFIRGVESPGTFKTLDPNTSQLSRMGPPVKGLTKQIDQAYHQQLVIKHEHDAMERKARLDRMTREHEEAEQARESHDDAVEDARKDYHEARAQVIKAKNALRDALAERDAETERIRGEAFISGKQALAQLAPIQHKVKQLLQEVVASKSEWEAAQSALESAEDIGTRPKLSFPAPFAKRRPVQQLATSHKLAASPAAAAAPPPPARAFSGAHAAAEAAEHDGERATPAWMAIAKTAPAAAAVAASAEQALAKAKGRGGVEINGPTGDAASMHAAARVHAQAEGHGGGGAEAVRDAARRRLAAKKVVGQGHGHGKTHVQEHGEGLIGGLPASDLKADKGPRTFGGADHVVPAAAAASVASNVLPSMF